MRIIFMGTPEFALPSFEALLGSHHQLVAVVTQPDRPSGRGQQLAPPPIKRAALAAKLPVYQPLKMKNPELHDRLRAHAPDLIVVVAFGRILPKAILDIPPRGCLNVHASLLPKYRGAAPIQWAILGGETETGVMTMLLDETMDTGPVYLEARTPIAADETAGSLAARLATMGAALLLQTLAGIETGRLAPRPQPVEGVTLAPPLAKEQGLIDWKQPAAAIDRLVRALDPSPGAFTYYQEHRWRLWRVRPGERLPDAPAPGTIVAVLGDRLQVAAGDGRAVEVLELQPSGGRRMSARDFLAGHSVEPGGVLGD